MGRSQMCCYFRPSKPHSGTLWPVLLIPNDKFERWCKINKTHKQGNNSQSIAVISYLQVVDDGDGVVPPTDQHGAYLAPGSVLRIELQDVVQGVASGATCIVLYYHTNCIGNNADHEQSPGYHCLYLLSPLYCPVWRPSDRPGVRGEQRSRSRRWRPRAA